MKLHRDLGITQKAAWHLAHRIRKAWESDAGLFSGPVEIDETYIGGLEKNKHSSKKVKAGRGPVGKTPVAAVKDRESNRVFAQKIAGSDSRSLHGFVESTTDIGAVVYTDEVAGYQGLPYRSHWTVKHSAKEYVKDQATTNSIESFFSMLKRGVYGTYHHISPKHTGRYAVEFAERHNNRPLDTMDMVKGLIRGSEGKRLTYSELTN